MPITYVNIKNKKIRVEKIYYPLRPIKCYVIM